MMFFLMSHPPCLDGGAIACRRGSRIASAVTVSAASVSAAVWKMRRSLHKLLDLFGFLAYVGSVVLTPFDTSTFTIPVPL